MEDRGLRLHVGVDRPVYVFVELTSFRFAPGLVAEIVGQRSQREIVSERHVAAADRAIGELHGQVLGFSPQVGVAIDGRDQGPRHHVARVVAVAVAHHLHHPAVGVGPLFGERLQFRARPEQPGMLPGH